MIRLAFVLGLVASSVAARAVLDTFDGDAQGWQTCNFDADHGVFEHFEAASWSATGGDPGGAILTGDVDDYCFLAAPATFLGDQSATFGTSLDYDTSTSLIDGDYPSVVLTSKSVGPLYGFAPRPGAVWTPTSIALVGSAWSFSQDPGGPAVSDATFKGALASLTGLYVQADWYGVAPDEITGLDNVRLEAAPAPEPASIAALGICALALRRQRRAS